MNANLKFTLNGKKYSIATDTRRTLLELLREDLKLTGTKYGCGEGQCRACTVLLNGSPVSSCLTPVSVVNGKKIQTIEGLAEGNELHPIQQAFLTEGAMQCGYCVSGMILTSTALLRRNPNPSQEEIIEAMNGNICRCCGYTRFLKAVRSAAKAQKEVKPK